MRKHFTLPEQVLKLMGKYANYSHVTRHINEPNNYCTNISEYDLKLCHCQLSNNEIRCSTDLEQCKAMEP